MERFKILKKSDLDELPKTSGVYCFYAPNPKPHTLNPIYIGKAINIQSRVKNHFNQPSYRDNLFIDKVDKVGYLETNSEIEALILEAGLIKKHQPKFNVVWRDDKNYFYVAIAQATHKIPYIYITHQPKNKFEIRNLKFKIEYVGPFVEGTALKKTLKFLRKVFPYYTSSKHPKIKCTWCHLGLCPGPELMENPPSPRLRQGFDGQAKASEGLREYRKNINKIILILKGKKNKVLYSLEKEMRQLSKENKFEEAGKKRDIISNLQQVMAHTNVINLSKVCGTSDIPQTLSKILGIKKDIHRIECYDVSNIQGKFATGSMVVFVDGKPDKSQYRKFKIKHTDTPNDIAMLRETLERRFAHSEWPYPEVILIDGGKAQLNVAIKIKKLKIILKIQKLKN